MEGTIKCNGIFCFSIYNDSAFILHPMDCVVGRDNDFILIILLEAGKLGLVPRYMMAATGIHDPIIFKHLQILSPPQNNSPSRLPPQSCQLHCSLVI